MSRLQINIALVVLRLHVQPHVIKYVLCDKSVF